VLNTSVLVPSYNAARYLAEALESAFAQDVPLHEVIVVDDGSTDETERVTAEFGGRVRYHRQAHAGIAAARNKAFELSSGDPIAFLDADDLWPAGSLAARLAALAADESLEYVYGEVEQFVSPELSGEWARRHEAAASTVASPARLGGAMLVRRRAFTRIGSFSESLRIGETIDWIARADNLGVGNRCLSRVVLRRRLHTTNSGLTQRGSRSDYLAVARAALARRQS
jgi:glycosyltransferase involved in cell wall biosynthesis